MHSMCLMYVNKLMAAKSKCSGAFPDNGKRLRAGSDLCRRIESHQTVISSSFHYFKWTDTFLSDWRAYTTFKIYVIIHDFIIFNLHTTISIFHLMLSINKSKTEEVTFYLLHELHCGILFYLWLLLPCALSGRHQDTGEAWHHRASVEDRLRGSLGDHHGRSRGLQSHTGSAMQIWMRSCVHIMIFNDKGWLDKWHDF